MALVAAGITWLRGSVYASSSEIRATPVSNLITDEGGRNDIVVVTIALTSRPTSDVTVPLLVDDPTEGLVTEDARVFTPLNYDVAQAFTVVGVDDDEDDGNVVYSLAIGPASSADPAYEGAQAPALSIINIDNDGPREQPPTLGFVTPLSTVTSGIPQAVLDVQLSKPSDLPIVVGYRVGVGGTALAGIDFSLDPGQLIFAPGETFKQIVLALSPETRESAATVRVELDDGPVHARLGRSEEILTISPQGAEFREGDAFRALASLVTRWAKMLIW
jgi:hypothetical protein